MSLKSYDLFNDMMETPMLQHYWPFRGLPSVIGDHLMRVYFVGYGKQAMPDKPVNYWNTEERSRPRLLAGGRSAPV